MKLNSNLASIVVSTLFLLFTEAIFPQGPQITWGTIPKSDLEMKYYPADTNASAVILYDFGESFLDDYLHIVFNRHLRVKILNANGFSWGTHSVDIYTASSAERIDDIEGATYWIENGGEIKSSALVSKDIFKEKISDYTTRYKFTLPSLKAGCVIEIKYKITSEHIFRIKGWEFQYSEPAVWSEYNLRSPKSIAFSSVTQGAELFVVKDIEDVTQIFSGEAESFLGRRIVPCTQHQWAVSNVPAIRDEPYITTVDDYKNRLDIQLAGYVSPGGGIKRVLEDWPKFIDDLLDSKYFGEKIDETSKCRKLVKEITANCPNTEEKIRAIYNWVSNSIVCTGANTIYADQDVNDVIEAKKGNNAEITFLLLSLLKSSGINGHPVVLSTRSNGRVQTSYPILSQFNYVLAKVEFDSSYILIDATDPLRPIDLLPIKVLNVRGLVIKENAVEWVTLTSTKKSYNVAVVNVSLNTDGSFNGGIEDAYKDYGALTGRRVIKDKAGIDFAKESFDAAKTGLVIDSVTVFGKDSLAVPFNLKTRVSAAGYAQCNGDLIYLNPQIINRLWENPFKTQKRNFPIDYAFARSQVTVTNITIPDSFEVKEKPEDRYYSACSGDVSFIRNFLIEGKKIQMSTKLEVKNSIINYEHYAKLREFYGSIVAAEQEQIVLSRIQKKPEPEPEKTIKPIMPDEQTEKKEPVQKDIKKKRKK